MFVYSTTDSSHEQQKLWVINISGCASSAINLHLSLFSLYLSKLVYRSGLSAKVSSRRRFPTLFWLRSNFSSIFPTKIATQTYVLTWKYEQLFAQVFNSPKDPLRVTQVALLGCLSKQFQLSIVGLGSKTENGDDKQGWLVMREPTALRLRNDV